MSKSAETEIIETKAASGLASDAGTSTAATGDDVAIAFDDFMRAFKSFKAENEQRIQQLEKRLPVDVLTTEKLARIDRVIDQHTSAARRAGAEIGAAELRQANVYRSGAKALEHKAAFETYVRLGEATGLRRLELKAMSIGSRPDGGYLVPPEIEQTYRRA